MSGTIYYNSVLRGIANPEGRRPIAYFGRVFRIPRSQHATFAQIEWEPSPEDLLPDMTLSDGTTLRPLTNGVIERFETYDQSTGDVLVMYRVPYQPVDARGESPAA